MKTFLSCAAFSACALLALPNTGNAAGPMPGLYEFTASSNLPVQPGEGAQQAPMRECITEATVGNIGRMANVPKDKNCEQVEKTDSGGKFSYKFRCTGPAKMEFAVSGTATTIVMYSSIEVGRGQAMQSTTSGKRIGDCKT